MTELLMAAAVALALAGLAVGVRATIRLGHAIDAARHPQPEDL